MLLLLIISACQSVEYVYVDIEYELPADPIRQEIVIDETEITLKQSIAIIIYYEHLVQEWEAWSKSVNKLLTGNEN